MNVNVPTVCSGPSLLTSCNNTSHMTTFTSPIGCDGGRTTFSLQANRSRVFWGFFEGVSRPALQGGLAYSVRFWCTPAQTNRTNGKKKTNPRLIRPKLNEAGVRVRVCNLSCSQMLKQMKGWTRVKRKRIYIAITAFREAMAATSVHGSVWMRTRSQEIVNGFSETDYIQHFRMTSATFNHSVCL